MDSWKAHLEREQGRFADGQERIPDDPDGRQRQLTRIGNAAYGAGLAKLMLGEHTAGWFTRAAESYEQSYADAPPRSWGRLVAMLKASILADDWRAAERYAERTLEEGAADAESPIGRYAAALAHLTLEQTEEARGAADSVRERDDFPRDVADALATLAAEDVLGYTYVIESVLESFEQRDEHLEDIPVADTVLVLQAFARRHRMAAELASPLLPPG